MAKSKGGKFGRTDIPYAQRLLMDKFNTIAEHSDHAALLAMKIATVALNDTEGMGYFRLSRFAKRQQQLTEEFYSDPDYMEVKLDQRLEQLGFKVVNGRLFGAVDQDGKAVSAKDLVMDDKETMLRLRERLIKAGFYDDSITSVTERLKKAGFVVIDKETWEKMEAEDKDSYVLR